MFQAIILGIVQGLTEFIPVSSSGHLIIVPRLFGWKDLGLGFDASVHLGTLVALIIYFRRDWISIISSFSARLFRGRPYPKPGEPGAEGRLMVPIVAACVPAAVVGVLWDEFIEQTLRQWYWVAGALVIVGLIMLLAEKLGKKERGVDRMTWADYLAIGCAQAMALFPGVSRSGITITAGLFMGVRREAAARFSFLLSTPIILGAGLMALKDAVDAGLAKGEAAILAAGIMSAAVSGYLAIHFLMSYLKAKPLNVFVYYRVALAVAVAIVFLAR